MLNAVVILVVLLNCIDGKDNAAKALLPLAPTSDSSILVQRIIADPKLFVSEMASADPQIIRSVVGMLQLLVQTDTTAINKFETDVTNAKTDEDDKIKSHDDLTTLVADLIEEKRLVTINLTAIIAAKTEEQRVAGEEKTAAVNHHTSMVTERDTNVPDLNTATTAISSAISLLEGLLPARDAGIPFTPSANVNVSVPGQLLATAGGWAVGTYSSESMPDSAIGFQFKVTDDVSHMVFGLSHGNTNVGYGDVDYGFCLRGQHAGRPLQLEVWVRGQHRGNFGNYVVGDVFTQIVGADNKVKFYRNAELFYTESSAPTLPLLVDASFYAPSSLTDIVWIYSWP